MNEVRLKPQPVSEVIEELKRVQFNSDWGSLIKTFRLLSKLPVTIKRFRLSYPQLAALAAGTIPSRHEHQFIEATKGIAYCKAQGLHYKTHDVATVLISLNARRAKNNGTQLYYDPVRG